MTERLRPGRPKKTAREKRTLRLWIQVNEEEYDRVCRKAVRADKSVSGYLRMRLPPDTLESDT